jgi:hypothetical protein
LNIYVGDKERIKRERETEIGRERQDYQVAMTHLIFFSPGSQEFPSAL